MDFDHTYADYLDSKAINEIQSLEKEMGKRILAYYSPPDAASLSNDHIKKIKALEDRLCVRLVAYENH